MFELALAAAMVAQAPSLVPGGGWQLSKDATGCTLARRFGAGTDSVLLALRPIPGHDGGELMLAFPEAAKVRTGSGQGPVTPSPAAAVTAEWTSAPVASGGQAVRIRVRKAFWEALPEATGLDIAEPVRLRLALGPMAAALLALRACGDEVARGWGMDPAAGVWLAAPETLVAFYDLLDFPEAGRRARAPGRLVMLATTDVTGKTTSCRVVNSSGDAELDRAGCAKLRRKLRFASDRSSPHPVRWFLFPL